MRSAVKSRIILCSIFGFSLLGFYVLAIPNRIGHQPSPQNICINNLRHVQDAKLQWAFEHQLSSNAIPSVTDLVKYLSQNAESRKRMFHCPSHGKYAINPIRQNPTCSVMNHVLP